MSEIEMIDINDVEVSGSENIKDLSLDESDTAQTPERRYLLVDTKPDYDIGWFESYQCNTWVEAYEKMIHLVVEVSSNTLESNLVNENAVISTYYAQTFDNDGVRRVYHIIGI